MSLTSLLRYCNCMLICLLPKPPIDFFSIKKRSGQKKLIPWNWCLGSWKVWKFGLRLSLPSHKRMYSEEPSSRRLNCTEKKTGQRRQTPTLDVLSIASFIHGLSEAPVLCTYTWHQNRCPQTPTDKDSPTVALYYSDIDYLWRRIFLNLR